MKLGLQERNPAGERGQGADLDREREGICSQKTA